MRNTINRQTFVSGDLGLISHNNNEEGKFTLNVLDVGLAHGG